MNIVQRLLARPIYLLVMGLGGGLLPGIAAAIWQRVSGAETKGGDSLAAQLVEAASSYVLNHSDRVFLLPAVLVVTAVSYTHLWPFAKNLWEKRILLKKVGIRAYLPRNSPEAREASWEDAVEHLLHSGTDAIRIMGANGWDTFGASSAPLHNVLRDCSATTTMEIMLLHPHSPSAVVRAASAKETVGKYKEAIRNSVAFCAKLKAEGRLIEVRLFDWPPVWKLIFSHDTLWLQHYEDGKAVDATPVYSFGREPKPSSLYHPFNTEFSRLWGMAEKIDLSLSVAEINRRWLGRNAPLPIGARCEDCNGLPHRVKQKARVGA